MYVTKLYKIAKYRKFKQITAIEKAYRFASAYHRIGNIIDIDMEISFDGIFYRYFYFKAS